MELRSFSAEKIIQSLALSNEPGEETNANRYVQPVQPAEPDTNLKNHKNKQDEGL
jgi:hypothetical protein